MVRYDRVWYGTAWYFMVWYRLISNTFSWRLVFRVLRVCVSGLRVCRA